MRLGLIAAARISGPAVIDAARSIDGVEVVAVAARSPERARASADAWSIPVAHGSYEALLDDPDVEAVYIATPAALHHRWTLAALAAGKDVLCEKPFAANAREAREMVAAATAHDRILMEAHHWRYHPLVPQLQAIIHGGRIDRIRHLHGVFDVSEGRIPRDDIRWDLALGGGALMDLGCYPLQWVRWAMGAEPRVVSATAECPVPGVDASLTAELAWDDGTTATIECSMVAPGPADIRLEVVGDDTSVLVTNPLAPQLGARIELRSGPTVESIAVDGADTTTYQHQLAAFRDAVATRVPPPTSGDDSIATMELIDACYVAAGLEPRPSLPGPSSPA